MTKFLRSLVPVRLHPGEVADRHLKTLLGNSIVTSGPFAEMRYIDRASGSAHIPKLIGSYEMELHGWIEQLRDKRFGTIIDIGAAEGYYAVGLALIFPNAAVIAYEASADARSMLFEMAAINGIQDRVEIRGICLPSDLRTLPQSEVLILMDVEGTEIELLDPENPMFRSATILFESHQDRNLIQAKILDPFSPTHSWTRVSSRPRSQMDIKHLNSFTRWWIRKVCSSWTAERDCIQDWFLFSPK
jgi:hypothetical protein